MWGRHSPGERQGAWPTLYPCCSFGGCGYEDEPQFLAPFRSTIGFDRVFDLLENASRTQSLESWSPYNIVRTSEDSYRITMVVAGFAESKLTITHQPNLLIVAGSKAEMEANISIAAFRARSSSGASNWPTMLKLPKPNCRTAC
jgi:hypothetical protein